MNISTCKHCLRAGHQTAKSKGSK